MVYQALGVMMCYVGRQSDEAGEGKDHSQRLSGLQVSVLVCAVHVQYQSKSDVIRIDTST